MKIAPKTSPLSKGSLRVAAARKYLPHFLCDHKTESEQSQRKGERKTFLCDLRFVINLTASKYLI